MSCDPNGARSPSGRLALGGLALVLALHLVVLAAIASPNVDETYRPTYVTGEFSIYPGAAPFGMGDGLDYRPGRAVALGPDEGRKYLARFEWRRWDLPVPNLGAFSGRLFLHVTAGQPTGRRAHRLRLGLTCRLPPGEEVRLEASMNGVPLGPIVCGRGPVEVDLLVPAGLLGSRRYDEIAITRPSEGLVDDIRTRLALRHDAIGLDWFGIDVPGLGPAARGHTADAAE
jgi:hypothetical protein